MYTIDYTPYKFLDWIEQHERWLDRSELERSPKFLYLLEKEKEIFIRWIDISRNPNAIHLLEQNQDKICWDTLSRNPNAIHLLEQNLDKIDWSQLSKNPNGIPLLEQNLDKIDWENLSVNPKAIHLLEQNPDKIDWDMLSMNENAIRLLEQNLDKVDWDFMSANSEAIHLLERNPDKINWSYLSQNPKAIHLLEQNLDKIVWYQLLINPNAMHLLKQHLIPLLDGWCGCWENLSRNSSIFEIDYAALKQRIEPFKEELIQTCFHPRRLVYYHQMYNYDIGEDVYQESEHDDDSWSSLNLLSLPLLSETKRKTKTKTITKTTRLEPPIEIKTGIHIFIDHSNIRVSGEKLLIHHDCGIKDILEGESKRKLKKKNKKLRRGLIPRVRIDIPRIVEVITDGREVLSRSVAGSFNAPKKLLKRDRIRYKGEQQIYQDLNFDILVSVQRGQKETSVDGAIAKAIQRCSSQNPGCTIIVASGDKSSNHGKLSIQEAIQQARKNGAYVETWGWEHQKCDKSLNGKGCAHIIGKLAANIGKVNL